MTYLEVVNNVLRRMREEEVANISQSTYSKMVGDFVNDAKGIIETSWDWSALRTTLVVPTVADTVTYSLTGSKDNLKVLDVINDTSNFFVEYMPSAWFRAKYYNNTPAPSGSPVYYSFNGVDTNGDTQVDVYPKPDSVYSLRFTCVIRKNLLSNNGDVLYIPSLPVIHLAIALLARERGETGGTSAPEYFSIADKYLSDAIALDAAKHPEETVWYS
tara:strand:+ start:747 stop:1394 length:648 start_codon:yes stop_codon:yes gene_type:complete